MNQERNEMNLTMEETVQSKSGELRAWRQPTITRIEMKKTMWAAGSPTDGTSSAGPFIG